MISLITIVFLVIDIISKFVITNFLELGESITIIDNFFNITYVRNTGAAWSMFSSNKLFVLLVSCIIIFLVIWYLYKNKVENKIEKIGYSLILGGAFGNLFDRIVYGYVIDFFDFDIFSYEYPIFNLADTFIVIGVCLLLITIIRKEHNNDNRHR